MDKNGNITISYDTWKDGIKSPLLGMGDMVNVDIWDEVGVLKIAKAPTQLTTSRFTDSPAFGAYRPSTNDVFVGDGDGELYEYDIVSQTLGDETDGDSGMDDGVWWQDYLIVVDPDPTTPNVDLDAYSGSAWTDSFATVSLDNAGQAAFHALHASPADNDLYIGHGRYVSRISAVGTFNPSSSGTFTLVDKFLTLPYGYVVKDIKTLSNFVVVSASLEGASTSSPVPSGARLYFWDLSQTATAAVEWTGFVDLSTNIAAPILPFNNSIYYYDWKRRVWGVTNLSSVADLFKLYNLNGNLTSFHKCADISKDNIILGLSSDTTDDYPAGVYVINDSSFTRNTISTGDVGLTQDVEISFITSILDDEYLVGWTTGSGGTESYGVDHFGKDDYRYTSYKAYIESPLYQVSGSLKKKSYQQVEVSLAKELATGQGIKVSYRKNLSDDWTVISTLDFATYGAKSQFNVPAKITDASTLQFKVELTTGASSTTTPELISVRVF